MYSRYPVRYVRTNDQCPDNIEAVRQQRERERERERERLFLS